MSSISFNSGVVTLGSLIAGEDQVVDVIRVEERYTPTNITTAATTAPTGAKYLSHININKPLTGTLIVKDGTVVYGTYAASTPAGCYLWHTPMTGGPTFVNGSTEDVTVFTRV
jgi:hypothetical protein